MLFGDVELFFAGIAVDLDDLHAVAQRSGDHGHIVSGRDKHDVRQIKRNVYVVVDEFAVLFDVEHLEQRRGRIALIVARELVDLVEDQQRIVGACVLDRRHDPARHGADIGAAVSADLRFVLHAAERDALAVSADRLGDRLRDRGLADAGRSHQAEHLSLLFLAELAHGKLLDDPVFDLLQAEVGLVQLLADLRQNDLIVGGDVPRQLDHGVEVGADDRRLLTAVGHFHQLSALLEERVPGLFRKPQLLDLIGVILGVSGRVVVLAELLLDGALLFAEEIELLALVDAVLRLHLDLVLELADIGLVDEHIEHRFQALGRVKQFENALFGLIVEIHGGCDIIRQLARIFAQRDLKDDVGRHFRGDVEIGLKLALDRADHRDVLMRRRQHLLGDRHHLGKHQLGVKHGSDCLGAVFALEHHAGDIIGLTQHLNDLCHNADGIQVDQLRLVDSRVLLRGKKNQLFLPHRTVNGGDTLLPADVKVDHSLWKNDHSPQRENGQRHGIPTFIFHFCSFQSRKP